MFKLISICALLPTLIVSCAVLPQTPAEVREKGLHDDYCSQQPFSASFDTIKAAMEKRYDRETGTVAAGATMMPGSKRAVRVVSRTDDAATLAVTFDVGNQSGLMLVIDLKRTEQCPTTMTVIRLNNSFWKQDSKDFAAAIAASATNR